eukprot:scaffold113673_cov69-Phaeocystis_antarctica.AAC.1
MPPYFMLYTTQAPHRLHSSCTARRLSGSRAVCKATLNTFSRVHTTLDRRRGRGAARARKGRVSRFLRTRFYARAS